MHLLVKVCNKRLVSSVHFMSRRRVFDGAIAFVGSKGVRGVQSRWVDCLLCR